MVSQKEGLVTLIAFRRLVAVVMTCACLLLPGCMCNSVAGTYADSEDAVTIELRSDGKASSASATSAPTPASGSRTATGSC